ncbi:thioredoxin family protein [Neiella marina]|uniref:Thioredoxin family protein n=1 Tax=Neiella holothuriorum TaxID=2870530 RepID=A0ABS7EMB5_9GAMM|nr:thioredoxin family protein [Neiella holothuriorum]MBW8192802.1 thioredoxin family protein [Neiella holothuriorum]
MKTFKVLGSGCKSCQTLATMIEHEASRRGVEYELVKVTQPQDIMAYGVMKTPAAVLDGQVIHKGSVPSKEAVERWFD